MESTFSRKIFSDSNANWDISKQFEGIISLPETHANDSGWLVFYDWYKDIDLTLNVKDYLGDYDAEKYEELRQVVWFEFANGKTASFSVTYSANKYMIQSMNDSTFGWTSHKELSEEQIASYQDDDGLAFRIVRTGTTVDIYLDGELVCDGIDLTTNSSGNATNVTADMKATVSMKNYGNLGEVVEIPFVINSADVVELYDISLFYANDKKTNVADPFVLDNTEVDGYYYLYGTLGACYCYRSVNLVDWEAIGNTIEISDVVSTNIWAPEVVYDEDAETYYMFFSATPVADTTYTDGNASQVLLVATSKYPYKDFTLVDFMDASSCGEENLHTYSESAYPHYYANYLMFDPEKYDEFSDKDGGYLSAIDPHPYVDEDENKYLFWVDSKGSDRICGVKMINWLQPDWSTAVTLTYSNYYTVSDWAAAQAGEAVDTVSYELSTVSINEGPVITEHDGKYYLTFSVNAYKDDTYQVIQAVSDSILGAYRKLTEEEGGILLSGSMADTETITGTGHHSFMTVGNQTYIIYHRHTDSVAMGSTRNHAIDEVQWVTIKDKDGNDLDVMYVNGPTSTPQPKMELYSDYRNIAGEAVVSGASDVSFLTDGLISKNGNETFMQYIKEITISETTTFTFDFEEAREVSAVMIYGSADIAKVELIDEENGKTKEVTLGTDGYVDFVETEVTSVRITVEVPEDQESVGISEIKILGQ